MVSKLRYCPACAGTLEIRPAGHPASPQPVCQTCGFVLWQNPKPSVQALILRGNGRSAEVLLGRLGMGPSKGRWTAPGGFLNLGDEPEPALIRECERELGVSVRVSELIGAFTDTFAGGELALFYRCELQSGEPRPADIVDAVAWFPVLASPEMAFESEGKAVRALQERLT
ncbi:MAG: NUDIX hydrolase [Acidimicrobiia bacterium]